jgi:hypothetical protein
VIVDEGHGLGAQPGALTNKLAMATQLTADRRWVMTGTPTPATSAGAAGGAVKLEASGAAPRAVRMRLEGAQ